MDLFWTVAVVLLALWFFGLIGGIGGELINILVVAAIVVWATDCTRVRIRLPASRRLAARRGGRLGSPSQGSASVRLDVVSFLMGRCLRVERARIFLSPPYLYFC